MSAKLLRMGFVGRPHGIKGDLSVDWAGEAMPKPGSTIYSQLGENPPQSWQVAKAGIHKGKLLLALAGVMDRNAAEALKGAQLLIDRADLPKLEPEEHFLADLLGCEVRLTDGSKIGVLDHVQFPAGQIVWSIKDDDEHEILFPARPEFIEDLDPEHKKIIISPPPGLLEIYRA